MSVCWLGRGTTSYVRGSKKKGPERGERRVGCVRMLAVPRYHAVRTWE